MLAVPVKTRGHRASHPSGPDLGLALGGGAARGLAHIPLIEALDDLGIKPRIIAGTSIGAIVGAAMAAGISGREMRAHVRSLFGNRREFFRRVATRWPGSLGSLWNPMTPAIFNGETLIEILLPETIPLDFEKLKIPFLAVATDFYAQEQVILDQGPLLTAIAASAALPAFLKPVRIGERVLIDGGFVNPVPFDIVMEKAAITIAVDVTGAGKAPRRAARLPGSLETWIGAAQITLRSIVAEKLRNQRPTILLRPAVGGFAALDFFKAEEILAAAEPLKDELKRQIERALAGH